MSTHPITTAAIARAACPRCRALPTVACTFTKAPAMEGATLSDPMVHHERIDAFKGSLVSERDPAPWILSMHHAEYGGSLASALEAGCGQTHGNSNLDVKSAHYLAGYARAVRPLLFELAELRKLVIRREETRRARLDAEHRVDADFAAEKAEADLYRRIGWQP